MLSSETFLPSHPNYGATILLAVLCGCETGSVTLREGHKLRLFENRVLRIYGQETGENPIVNQFLYILHIPDSSEEILLINLHNALSKFNCLKLTWISCISVSRNPINFCQLLVG